MLEYTRQIMTLKFYMKYLFYNPNYKKISEYKKE